MSPEAIQDELRKKVAARISLVQEGINRLRVLSPFRFEDGDHLAIVLRREGDDWVFSDEGHTLMHLTYEMDERSIQQGTRQKVISNALSMFGVEDRGGELRLAVNGGFGDALFSFVQAVLKIGDVSFLSRERVSSAFMEDFFGLLKQVIPEDRRTFDWHDADRDPMAMYRVDCRVNGGGRPLFLYGLNNDDKTRDTTISLLQFERWNWVHQSIGVFEDQETINRKVLARFSDVCGRMFSSLPANRDRISREVKDLLRMN
jgi:hypothetical protein